MWLLPAFCEQRADCLAKKSAGWKLARLVLFDDGGREGMDRRGGEGCGVEDGHGQEGMEFRMYGIGTLGALPAFPLFSQRIGDGLLLWHLKKGMRLASAGSCSLRHSLLAVDAPSLCRWIWK